MEVSVSKGQIKNSIVTMAIIIVVAILVNMSPTVQATRKKWLGF